MSLAELATTLPPARAERLQGFLALGWPHRKLEAWHYTDLSSLARRDWTLPELPAEDNAQPVAANDHFGLLNSALALPGELPETVAADAQAHRQACKAIASGQTQRLVLAARGEVHGLRSHWQQLALAADSTLDLVWVGETRGSGHDLHRISAQLAENARLNLVVIHLGEARTRLELDITLAGPGAAIHLHTLSLPLAGEFDLPARIHHAAPRASSRLSLRAIGLGPTRSSLNGHIKVAEGAVKTDSEQHMASLLLSPKAEINAKPDLEIYNDDVKCAHGASFGQLDPDALFYLRARGLDEASARGLLIQAFAQAVLDEIADEALRARLSATLLTRLQEAPT